MDDARATAETWREVLEGPTGRRLWDIVMGMPTEPPRTFTAEEHRREAERNLYNAWCLECAVQDPTKAVPLIERRTLTALVHAVLALGGTPGAVLAGAGRPGGTTSV